MTAPATIREYQVRATTTSTFGRVLVNARHHHIVVDGPVQNGCPGEALTPPEIFLGGIAACAAELIPVIARETGSTVGAVEVSITGIVDRGRQSREDVTVFTRVELDLVLHGANDATAARLVEGFKRR